MAYNNIFEWLVDYHSTTNLEMCRPSIVGGAIRDEKGLPLVEGSDKKTPHDGILILKNGTTLIDKLVKDGRVNRKDIDDPIDVSTKMKFHDFLTFREEEDGVFVYESSRGHVRRVCHVYPINSDHSIESSVPGDFIFYEGMPNGQSLRLKLGTKTRLAIELTKTYSDIDAYQIKRSAYGNLGMGKITHFNKDGLAEEYFLMHAPENLGPFIDEENRIIGVHRAYSLHDGVRLKRVKGPHVSMYEHDYDLHRERELLNHIMA